MERDVVLEEVRQDATASAVLAEEALDALLWPGHPLARAPVGTEPAVQALERRGRARLLAALLRPGRTIVAVAGDVPHEEVLRLVESLAEGWVQPPAGDAADPDPPMPAEPAEPELELRYASGQTTYVYAGVRGLPSTHPDRPALELLSCALGELASSRLWADLRDTRGLAYDVGSEVTAYADTGGARMWAGVPPRRQTETVERMLAQAESLQGGLPAGRVLPGAPLHRGRADHVLRDDRGDGPLAAVERPGARAPDRPGRGPGHLRAPYPEDVARVATLWGPGRLQVAVAGPAPRRRRACGRWSRDAAGAAEASPPAVARRLQRGVQLAALRPGPPGGLVRRGRPGTGPPARRRARCGKGGGAGAAPARRRRALRRGVTSRRQTTSRATARRARVAIVGRWRPASRRATPSGQSGAVGHLRLGQAQPRAGSRAGGSPPASEE